MALTGRDTLKITIFAIIATFIIFGVFLILSGVNPIEGYKEIFSYAYSPSFGLPLTIRMSIFMLLVTLAFIVPLKAGIWNIGATGQFYLGTVGAFGVAYVFSDLPSVAIIPLMLVAGALCGAGYGAIAGFLKGKLDVNEIVVTIMLNLIAYWLIHYLIVGGPWMGTAESMSKPLPVSARAPMIWEIPFTIFVAIAISVLLYFLLTKFSIGYQIRALGCNPAAAKYAGVSPLKISLVVMIVGGAIAGLAGYSLWAGDPGLYKIPKNYYQYGELAYYGIVCGLICGLNPLAAIPTAIFVSGMITGGGALTWRIGMGFGANYVLLGILFLTLIAFQFFNNYKVTWKRRGGG
jgi:simple sugar transport system permease protein